MSSLTFLSSLNLVTLVLILAIGSAMLIFFLRKRSNRHPMEGVRERNIAADLDADKARERSPDGGL